jgi:hypothetical protein
MRVTGPEGAPSRIRRALKGSGRGCLQAPSRPRLGTGPVEVELAPDASLPAHAHGQAETLVYVVSGAGASNAR